MKKENGLLLVGILGFLAVIGFLSLKKRFEEKDVDYYSDMLQKNLKEDEEEDYHGVEYYALK